MEKQIKEAKFKDVLKTIQGKTKNPVWTKDFLGRKVFVGDLVATTYSSKDLYSVTVSRVTPKGIRDAANNFHASKTICKINP